MIVRSESFRPNPENLQAIHDIGAEIAPFIGDNVWAQGYIAGNSLRISHDLGLLENFAPKTGLVVDVGAIPPLLITAARRRFPHLNIEGLDLDPKRFSGIIDKLGLTINACNIEVEKIPYDDESVDLMIVNEIFEHMRINLIKTFQEIRRILKPGAIMLMSTPNGLAAHSLARMIRTRRIGPSIYFEYAKLERVGHMGHVREYAVKEVLEFFHEMDFEVPQIIYRGRYHRRWIDGILRIFPSYRPYVSFVIRKPAN